MNNRDIKFRAWNGIQMLIDLTGWFVEFDGQVWHNVGDGCGDVLISREVELMQYTGLKDKNGVEIYEGDVVRYKSFQRFRDDEYEKTEVVTYYVGSRVGFEPMLWDTNVEDGFYNDEREDFEVIGNIHENPDLLK